MTVAVMGLTVGGFLVACAAADVVHAKLVRRFARVPRWSRLVGEAAEEAWLVHKRQDCHHCRFGEMCGDGVELKRRAGMKV